MRFPRQARIFRGQIDAVPVVGVFFVLLIFLLLKSSLVFQPGISIEFANPADMRPAIAGRPVYLAMAMDGERRLKLKPQNLLLNLPLARQQ